jgi:hypothetical protein
MAKENQTTIFFKRHSNVCDLRTILGFAFRRCCFSRNTSEFVFFVSHENKVALGQETPSDKQTRKQTSK